jgi:hypothetical protein
MSTYGSKYHATQALDVAEVAKLVRADIKAVQAADSNAGLAADRGRLPRTLGYGVRIARYSMGKSVTVTVTGMADRDHFTTDGYGRTVLTSGAQLIEDTLKAILWAYNYDNSDGQRDYYEGRFAAEVDIETEDIAAAEAAYRDRQAARRARRPARRG